MNFYFIYSAGGGAGDWNGVKRVWNDYMPENLKSRLLLKFGDIFLNHASADNFIRPRRWETINNLRDWLYEAVSDDFVYSKECNILLDSGTAKAVNLIANKNPNCNCNQLINGVNKSFHENNVFEKYVSVVCNSNINSAVTFDIPNPFKIRSQNGDTRLNLIEKTANDKLIALSAEYSNIIYEGIKSLRDKNYADSIVMTVINGTWEVHEIALFFDKLNYTPAKIAIGGLSSEPISEIEKYMENLKKMGFGGTQTIHFLGCGGLEKAKAIKANGFSGQNISVDVSTYINRSIDGNVHGTTYSGYFDYITKSMIRIKPDTKKYILDLHAKVDNPLYTCSEMEAIIDSVLLHQSNHPSRETYNGRAKLMFHNADVFRYNVEE